VDAVTEFSQGARYWFDMNNGRYTQKRRTLLVYMGRVPAKTKTGGLGMFFNAAAGWRETFTDEQLDDYRITRQLDKEEALPGPPGARGKPNE
jgi:hypothetical protein